MPELPEVETIRAYLQAFLPGRQVMAVRHLDPRMVKMGSWDSTMIGAYLPGLVVQSMERRGKYLLIRFPEQAWLAVHLGMSGRLVIANRDQAWKNHTHMVLEIAGGEEMRLIDPRRFGRLGMFKAERPEDFLQLGPEPLGHHFTSSYLSYRLQKRSTAIKSLLLDQALLAGLGNIYVDEALFKARIHPLTPGQDLPVDAVARLVRAIRLVLREGIRHRGTSFSDYVDALGHPGENQDYLSVYGRFGQPCVRCGNPIQRIVIHQRTSHFCQRCQLPLEPWED